MGKKVNVVAFGLNESFLHGLSQEQMVTEILRKIDTVSRAKPDLIVLPEAFLKTGGDAKNPDWENITAKMLKELRARARELNCYIAAPVYERAPGYPDMRYNTVFLIGRGGDIEGKYRKVHTVVSETVANHVLPGDDLPVFDTDFGRIGFQTCFDIGWRDGWRILKEKGAQLVIWTAAYDGGNLLNTYAAYNMYYVVSSVRTDHARIIDLTGRTVAEGARWNGTAIAVIDLETTLYHIDDQYPKIDEIRTVLGDKVTIRAYSEENVFTIESNSPDWPRERIEKEFSLISYEKYHEEATKMQEEWRKKYPAQ